MLPFQVSPWTSFYAPIFSHTYYWYVVDMCETEGSVGGGTVSLLNSDHTISQGSGRSVSGGHGAICSFSRAHKVAELTSTESEYLALVAIANEVKFLCQAQQFIMSTILPTFSQHRTTIKECSLRHRYQASRGYEAVEEGIVPIASLGLRHHHPHVITEG